MNSASQQRAARRRQAAAPGGALLLGAALLCTSGCALWEKAPWTEAVFHRESSSLEAGDHVSTAMTRYQSGDIDGALTAARRAKQLDPELASAGELEALFLADLGDQTKYAAALRAVIDSHPGTPHLQNAAGRMLIRAGDRDAGLAAMQRAVQAAPQVTAYARDLAGVWVDQGDMPAAIAVLTAACRRNPEDTSLPVALARLHESTGNWKYALDYYTVALHQEPRNSGWRRQRARCLYRMQDYSGAADEFQITLEVNVASLSTADRIEFGDACLRIGDVDRAAWLFDDLAARSPPTRELAILRGVCELRRNDARAAQQIFTSALERWPADPALTLLLESSRKPASGVIPAGGTEVFYPPR